MNSGESRDKSKEAAVPDGTQRYVSDDELPYSHRVR